MNKHFITQQVFQTIQASGLDKNQPDYNLIYDSARVRCTNGRKDASTYEGHNYATELTRVAETKLKALFPESNVQTTSKIEYAAQSFQDNQLALTSHCYVTINADKVDCKRNPEDVYIVDVTYRELLMIHSGFVDKWSSDYGNYIYTMLPPIYVGTIKELKQLNTELTDIRKLDPFHNKDDLGNNMRWFDNPLRSFNHSL